MLEQLVDLTETLIGPQCRWLQAQQNLILTSLVCALSFLGAARVIRDGRKIGAAVRRDVLVQLLWYTITVLCSMAVAWFSWPGASVYQWVDDFRLVMPFWMFNVLLASLLCRAGFTIRRSDNAKFQWVGWSAAAFASLAVLCVLFADVTMIPGLITIAVLSIEMSSPHVFRGFSMPPNGAEIHTTAAQILTTSCFCLALSGVCLFCSVKYWRRPSRWRLVASIVTISIFATAVWYLDSGPAARLSAALQEFLFSNSPSRVITAFVIVLPIASIAGRSVARNTSKTRSCDPEPEASWLCWLERSIFVMFFANLGLNFYADMLSAVSWAGLSGGIRSLMSWMMPIQLVGTAVGMLSAAYAFGRSVDMRWSRRIVYPGNFIEHLSISGTLFNTMLIAVQMVGLSVSLAWVVLVLGYLPLP